MTNKNSDLEKQINSIGDLIDLQKLHDNCLFCDYEIRNSNLYKRFRICPSCRYHYTTTLRRKIAILADRGSFQEINKWIESTNTKDFSPKNSYKKRFANDQKRTNLNEAVITGECLIGGNRSVLIVLDSSFLGGTMGLVVGEKISLALEYAGKNKIPAIGIITSSGKRFQEGILSLHQMAKTVISTKSVKENNNPFIVILGNPCTGPVLSSFASMADIIFAEPKAHLGFASLGELREVENKHIYEDHLSEFYFDNGQIDKIIERHEIKNELSTILSLISTNLLIKSEKKYDKKKFVEKNPKQTINIARNKKRPTSKYYLKNLFTDFIELHGDRISDEDKSITLGIGKIFGQTVVVVAQEKSIVSENKKYTMGQITPSGFRKAIRGAKLAETLNLSFITLIDSLGPKIGTLNEKQGLASSISNCINEVANIKVPSVSIIIGEGISESAIAFSVTDRTLMMENSIYSSVKPEAAAKIETNEIEGIDDIANALKLTAIDCKNLGVIDEIIQEPLKGAHDNPKEAMKLVENSLIYELSNLNKISSYSLVKNRYKKIRNTGEYSNKYKSNFIKEINYLGKGIKTSIKSFRIKKDSK